MKFHFKNPNPTDEQIEQCLKDIEAINKEAGEQEKELARNWNKIMQWRFK